jgi:hypothetical protein
LDSTSQSTGTAQQRSGIGCCGCFGTGIIAVLVLAIVGTIFASGNISNLVVLCVIALAGYVAWRTLRKPNYATTAPGATAAPDCEQLGHEVKLMMERLREPIKDELRKRHDASGYDEMFTFEFIDLICRFAALDGTVDESEGKVFINILKILHPKTYAGMTANDGASLMTGHLQRHPEVRQSSVEQTTLLMIASQAGITYWTDLKQLLSKVAFQVAAADGPLSEQEKAELELLRNIAPNETTSTTSLTSDLLTAQQPLIPNLEVAAPHSPHESDNAWPSSTSTLESLKEATKSLLEGLEELLKPELRKVRQSGMARDLLEQNIREVIIRFGVSDGSVSPDAAELYLDIFRSLHPRTFGGWTVGDARTVLRGIAEQDKATYYGVAKKPFTLGLIENFDASHGTNFAKSFRDLLLAIALFAAAKNGTLSDDKKSEISRHKALIESAG